MITYRGADEKKPVSCELSELEVFSCVLGLEDETALAIVEPANLHAQIDGDRVLHVRANSFCLFCLFLKNGSDEVIMFI